MVPDLEKWSEMWKNGRRSGKWSQIWLNGCKIGKFFADLEKFLQI